MRILLLAFLPLLLALSCRNKQAASDSDWIAFASYGCECSGHCANVYKIEGNQLFSRSYEYCIMEPLDFPDPALSQEKYELANTLADALPQQLLDSPENRYGCPDCGDWGGYAIFINKDGVLRRIDIDTMQGNLPEWLKPYGQQIGETLLALAQ